MEEKFKFTDEERTTLLEIAEQLKSLMGDEYAEEDAVKVRAQIESELQENKINRDVFGLNPILMSFRTALLELEEIGMKRDCVLSILLYNSVANESLTIEQVEKEYGASIAHIIRGLVRIHELYRKSPVIESENFRNLLLSFAEDMRVVLIMISERVVLMRHIRDTENNEAQQKVAEEASYLYAPLAHKLGLYKLKSELEDLSLKYLEHDAYYMIKEKLNETKRSRDAYIAEFIAPIQKKLQEAGLRFDIKGRTKSIHSINNKLKKPYKRQDEEHTLDMAEDEEAAMRIRGHLRPLRYTHHHRLTAERREDAMLADLLAHHRYVPAEPETHEGLDLHPEDQRLRELAHHGDGPAK